MPAAARSSRPRLRRDRWTGRDRRPARDTGRRDGKAQPDPVAAGRIAGREPLGRARQHLRAKPGPWSERRSVRPRDRDHDRRRPMAGGVVEHVSMIRSSRRGSVKPCAGSVASGHDVRDGGRPGCARSASRSTQRRSAVTAPFSSREISSRSSTSVCSRVTRSRTTVADLVGLEQARRRHQPVSGVRRSWATSATNRCSCSIRSCIDSAIRSIAAPSCRHLVAAAGVHPRGELAAVTCSASGRRAPQPTRQPPGQRGAEERAPAPRPARPTSISVRRRSATRGLVGAKDSRT